MQQDLLFFLVIAVLLSVGGVTLLVLGLRGLRRDRAMREQERTHTEGRIAEVNKHPGTRYRRGNTWHPVVEYTADGKTLKEESALGYPMANFEVGEQVDISYDAEHPEHFHLEKLLDWHTKADRMTVIVGIMWVISAVIGAWVIASVG